MNSVRLLKYGTTNTYLIEGRDGFLLVDTGWAGKLPEFFRALDELHIVAQEISYVLLTHFHPDHMGIAQDIAEIGAQVLIMDVQKEFVHCSDAIFAKERGSSFKPIDESRARALRCAESRAFLRDFGIEGEILHTPGHSDDSVSLWLDQGDLFVGDLNPLYELELHRDTQIGTTWEMLLAKKPKKVYYGHANPAVLSTEELAQSEGHDENDDGAFIAGDHEGTAGNPASSDPHLYSLVEKIMKYIDKGMDLKKIEKKTGADPVFVEDVTRMYLTHTNVGVQGILDRIEIKGR
ncbi:MAG: MBL fold metallo-hydrolase [Lachnospiraceae bacterium]|nr:MBL fold metallo-hydrolase [Lachnospiraceae bacterium]